MKRIDIPCGKAAMRAGLIVLLLLSALPVLFGCNYGRMRDDEAVQTYAEELPTMPKRTIPVAGGIWEERDAIPGDLVDPLRPTPEIIAWGAERYGFYCAQCHGWRADGNGTVGQSFAPLPTNLAGPRVQDQANGELFYRIRFGFNRHPPLYATVTDDETWAVILYLRAFAGRL